MLLSSCATAPNTDMGLSSRDAQANVAPNLNWALRLPSQELVDFRGVADFDNVGGGTRPIVYPAPNAIVLAIGLIAHGIVSETVQNTQRNRVRTQADAVLAPYQSILANFKTRELYEHGIRRIAASQPGQLVDASAKAENLRWTVHSMPVFSMTQDQIALALHVDVQIFSTKDSATPVYSNTIKIVSAPIEPTEPNVYWNSNLGEPLKAESAKLFATAIELALNEVENPLKADGAQKTFRYIEGKIERMERGELLAESCDRMTIRTLRGWILSIPRKIGDPSRADVASCHSSPARSG